MQIIKLYVCVYFTLKLMLIMKPFLIQQIMIKEYSLSQEYNFL